MPAPAITAALMNRFSSQGRSDYARSLLAMMRAGFGGHAAQNRSAAVIVLVMGVAGAGKTTIGDALARALGWRFIDADDYHPPQNVAKMTAGIPLEDADRWPWLARLNRLLKEEENAVLACSALKERYRDRLASEGVAHFAVVYLHGDAALIIRAAPSAEHRYMPASLLESQFAALEPPARGRIAGRRRRHARGLRGGDRLRAGRQFPADHLELDSAHHRCRGAMHLELAVGVLDVAAHRVRRDAEARRDLAIAAPARQQADDIGFAKSEHVQFPM